MVFFNVCGVNISRTLIINGGWLEAEQEDDDMEVVGIICCSNEVRKWFFYDHQLLH